MNQLSYQKAHEIIDKLSEQELEIIFREGSQALTLMGVCNANNPDGIFDNIAEAHAVASIVNPTHTIPDDLYDDVSLQLEKRQGMANIHKAFEHYMQSKSNESPNAPN